LTDVLTERRQAPREERLPPKPQLNWAYFFDIDGTLAEIASHPRGARIERKLRDLIERLYRESGGAVALITGRSIGDADRLTDYLSMPIAGQHGVERRTALGETIVHEFDAAGFHAACEEIQEQARAHSGIVIELKGASVALHYREVPELENVVQEIMKKTLAKLGAAFTCMNGKMVIEIKPAGRDKGIAIREFLAEPPFKGRTPVFAGDDVTDEHGFLVVNDAGGHSIKVGGGPTVARWRLRTVTAVHDWLAQALTDS
jgi:trehalose 6-phosphate phosphatase